MAARLTYQPLGQLFVLLNLVQQDLMDKVTSVTYFGISEAVEDTGPFAPKLNHPSVSQKCQMS